MLKELRVRSRLLLLWSSEVEVDWLPRGRLIDYRLARIVRISVRMKASFVKLLLTASDLLEPSCPHKAIVDIHKVIHCGRGGGGILGPNPLEGWEASATLNLGSYIP